MRLAMTAEDRYHPTCLLTTRPARLTHQFATARHNSGTRHRRMLVTSLGRRCRSQSQCSSQLHVTVKPSRVHPAVLGGAAGIEPPQVVAPARDEPTAHRRRKQSRCQPSRCQFEFVTVSVSAVNRDRVVIRLTLDQKMLLSGH